MKTRLDVANVRNEGTDPLQRLIRLVLVAYLSPVILVVMAIGFVGMLAAKIGKPVARTAVGGAKAAHKVARPLGLDRTPTRVRETA